MDRETHGRYLDYREKHVYFGGNKPMISSADFEAFDKELSALEALGEKREDEDEVRYEELSTILHRD